jgi:SpoVK/Ycf46/Vps4 family AAA+-type ATPase
MEAWINALLPTMSGGFSALPRQDESGQLEESRPTRLLDSLLLDTAIVRSIRILKLEDKMRAQLAANGLATRNKFLLHGPPGNGKTAITQAIAATLGVTLYTARYDELTNSHLGASEKAVVATFKQVAGKRCVLFFDEADSLLGTRITVSQSCDAARNNCTNLCLQQLDRLDNRVIFVAATNRFEDLDPAVKRRFDESIYFAPPTFEQKQAYLAGAVARMPIFGKPKFRAAAEQALALDAPSFAEIEHKLKNLARELILKSLREGKE